MLCEFDFFVFVFLDRVDFIIVVMVKDFLIVKVVKKFVNSSLWKEFDEFCKDLRIFFWLEEVVLFVVIDFIIDV